MKITGLNTTIITNDSDSVVKTFEELGFSVTHEKTGISENDITVKRMKNEGGFFVDIAQAGKVESDITLLRMNVDNLEEAEKILAGRGFKEIPNTRHNTGTSLIVTMQSPTGFAIDVCEHIK